MTGITLLPWIINKTVSIHAPRPWVWEYLTDPVLMKRWMSDAELTINSTWLVGSPIIFKGDLHGIKYENKGIIIQIKNHEILEYSYLTSISGFADRPENYSLITFILTGTGIHTTLALKQSNFLTEINYRHFNFYWNVALEIMKKLVEGS